MSEKIKQWLAAATISHIFGTERGWSRPYLDIYALLKHEFQNSAASWLGKDSEAATAPINGAFLEIRYPNNFASTFVGWPSLSALPFYLVHQSLWRAVLALIRLFMISWQVFLVSRKVLWYHEKKNLWYQKIFSWYKENFSWYKENFAWYHEKFSWYHKNFSWNLKKFSCYH